MSDIKLFRTVDGTAAELAGSSVALEKSLQNLMEKNLDAFLGVRFLASEYSTGKIMVLELVNAQTGSSIEPSGTGSVPTVKPKASTKTVSRPVVRRSATTTGGRRVAYTGQARLPARPSAALAAIMRSWSLDP